MQMFYWYFYVKVKRTVCHFCHYVLKLHTNTFLLNLLDWLRTYKTACWIMSGTSQAVFRELVRVTQPEVSFVCSRDKC